MWTHDNDKAVAVSRLTRAAHVAHESGLTDQEELEHLLEILRLIEERVPAECFAGMGDFKGAA